MSVTIKLREHEVADPKSHPDLRVTLSDEESAIVDTVNASGRLEIVERKDGLRIKANRYVGAVSIGDVSIQIRPKLGPEHLPSFLRYAIGVQRYDMRRDTRAPIAELGFIDLIALLFLDEFDALRQAGLLREYRTREAPLTSPKGRIQFDRLARIPPSSTLALPCRFDERTHDISLNRLLLATLNVLRGHVSDFALAFDLHTRSAMLAEFVQTPSVLDAALLDTCRHALNRLSQYYEHAVDLAELILRSMGVTALSDHETPLPGFLFDMALLFERFVARLCTEYAPPDLRVDTQVSTTVAYRYIANPFKWPRPSLRPDIVIRDLTGAPVRILDTKYKLLGAVAPSPSDLYQLTLYSLGFDQNRSVPARIIYPNVQQTSPASIAFRGFGARVDVSTIDIVGIDVPQCAQAIDAANHQALKDIMARLLS